MYFQWNIYFYSAIYFAVVKVLPERRFNYTNLWEFFKAVKVLGFNAYFSFLLLLFPQEYK